MSVSWLGSTDVHQGPAAEGCKDPHLFNYFIKVHKCPFDHQLRARNIMVLKYGVILTNTSLSGIEDSSVCSVSMQVQKELCVVFCTATFVAVTRLLSATQ